MLARPPRLVARAPFWTSARPARWVRRARLAALAPVLALAAACGDDKDSTGPSGDVNGTYSLTQLQGQATPFSVSLQDGRQLEVGRGALVLEDGQYQVAIELALDGEDASLEDTGSFERSGSQLRLQSSQGGGTSQGTLSNSNRVLDVVDDDGVRYRFERD